jgi:hypothetical protein
MEVYNSIKQKELYIIIYFRACRQYKSNGSTLPSSKMAKKSTATKEVTLNIEYIKLSS